MKKALLYLLISFSTFTLYAQDDEHVITFGLSGGADLAFLQLKSAHRQEVLTDAESPISLGINADFKFNNYFSIRPGLQYAGKGGSMNAVYDDASFNNISITNEYKLHYLEIPVDFIGHLPIGEGANIYLGTGPYFAYGLNGTNLQTVNLADPVKHNISYGRNGDFKPTDYGITTVLGFRAAKGWSIDANIDFGVINVMQNNTSGFDASQFKTITFYIGIGQSF